MKMHLMILVLFLASLLKGCAVHQGRAGKDVADKSNDASKKAEAVYASFDPDTVYDLMVAELGGGRQHYDVALGNYLKQAHKTKDVGIIKRAYQIADFVGARQAALDAVLLWSKVEPNNTEALYASILELIKSGDYEQSISRIYNLLKLDSQFDLELVATQTEGLTDDGKESLQEVFSKAIVEHPNNHSLTLSLAILFHQNGRLDEALALCDRILKKDSENVRGLVIKGRILAGMGREDDAEKMLANAVKRHPKIDRLRLIYARVLVSGNKLDLARKQFEILLKHGGDNVEIILSLGLITMENGMKDEAEEYFLRILALGRQVNTANFYLGKISESKEDWIKAQSYYSEVTASKEFMMSQASMAQMLGRNGQWSQARKLIEEARGRYPEYGEQLYLLEGDLMIRRKELNHAIELYSQALKRYPDNTNLLYSRAMVYESLGSIKNVEADLRKVLTVNPDNAAVLNALGYTLADKTDRLQEAAELIGKAYEINSEDPSIIDSMGWIQYRLGNLIEAEKLLRLAYEKFPDGEVAAHLGEVLWKKGNKTEARSMWLKALKEQFNHDSLKEVMRRLDPAYRSSEMSD